MSTHLHQTSQVETLNKVNMSVCPFAVKKQPVWLFGSFLCDTKESCHVLCNGSSSAACLHVLCVQVTVTCYCMHLRLLLSTWQLWHTILIFSFMTPAHHISCKTANYIVCTLVAVQLPLILWPIISACWILNALRQDMIFVCNLSKEFWPGSELFGPALQSISLVGTSWEQACSACMQAFWCNCTWELALHAPTDFAAAHDMHIVQLLQI